MRNPLIGRILDQARVDTVVHLGAPRPDRHASRSEHGTGSDELLTACERSSEVRHVVLASSTAVYGAGPRDPGVFTEQMHAAGDLPPGAARTALATEHRLRAYGRRRPDVDVAVLRLAPLVGPAVDSCPTRLLSLPVAPTALGFDARLQLLHESDAIEVMYRAAVDGAPGVTNVAADGVVTLSQALRWARRLRLPLPPPALAALTRLARPVGPCTEDVGYLSYGRVVDTTRLKTRFGYEPRFTTEEALRSFLQTRPGPTALAVAAVGAAQRVLSTGRA